MPLSTELIAADCHPYRLGAQMIIPLPTTFPCYIHFQDFVDAWVGPFQSLQEVQDHLAFVSARGDSAVVMGFPAEPPEDADMVLTPTSDREWVDPRERG